MIDQSAADLGKIRVGTSGWQYADWRQIFYPVGLPQRAWLDYFAQRFNTVEVNSTFYRLPSVETVERWAQALPAGFLMAVKVSRYLTHVKRLREPAEPVERLLGVLEPLRRRSLLGPVLVQLPPDFGVAPERLAATLAAFPEEIDVAVEPRHASWFIDEVRDVLASRRAALVWADRDGRSTSPLWETCEWRYLRLHHGRHDWSYDGRDLRRWADRLRDAERGFVFANNDPGGAALEDAGRLRRLLTGQHSPAAFV
ncbi:MAG TPA: DUF72 domain-containing protein [Mycobacteriales bacterium]|nr:DUF72 domain-containing protein [Mycobacteriales bacterium]